MTEKAREPNGVMWKSRDEKNRCVVELLTKQCCISDQIDRHVDFSFWPPVTYTCACTLRIYASWLSICATGVRPGIESHVIVGSQGSLVHRLIRCYDTPLPLTSRSFPNFALVTTSSMSRDYRYAQIAYRHDAYMYPVHEMFVAIHVSHCWQ